MTKKFSLILITFCTIYAISCTPSSKDISNSTGKDSIISSVLYDRINTYSGKRYIVNLYLYASGNLSTEISDSNGTKIYSHQYKLPDIQIPATSSSVSGYPPIAGWLDSNDLLISYFPNTTINGVLIYPKYDFMSVIDLTSNTNSDKIFVANNASDSEVAYPPILWYNKNILVPVKINNNIYALTSYDHSFNISYAENTTNIDNYDNILDKYIPLSYSTYISYRNFPTNISKMHLNGQKNWTTSIPFNQIPLNTQSLDSLTSQMDNNTVILKTKYTLNGGKDTTISFVIDTATGNEIMHM